MLLPIYTSLKGYLTNKRRKTAKKQQKKFFFQLEIANTIFKNLKNYKKCVIIVEIPMFQSPTTRFKR